MHFLAAPTLWQKIDQWDKWLFIQINSGFTNPFFDAVFPFLRASSLWAPLYLFVIVFAIYNWGRQGLMWSLIFVCTAAITDLVGHRVFKEGFERLRPCNDPDFFMHVRLLVKHCSGGYSFTSNHAANHFGLATFFYLTMNKSVRRWAYLGYFWAFFIVWAQVYVGVHYPLDIVGGTILGVLAGLLTAWIFNTKVGSFTLESF